MTTMAFSLANTASSKARQQAQQVDEKLPRASFSRQQTIADTGAEA